jgi:ABC-type multidrug transport system fused ATPase/permease subunit
VEVRARRHPLAERGRARRCRLRLLWQVGAVAAPLMVKKAIDRGVLTHDHSALLAWLGALLLVGLLEMTAGAVRHLYAIRNRARSDARVRDAIFAHALRLDASYHDRVGPGRADEPRVVRLGARRTDDGLDRPHDRLRADGLRGRDRPARHRLEARR